MRLEIDFSGKRRAPNAAAVFLLLLSLIVFGVALWEYLTVYRINQQSTKTLAGAQLQAINSRSTLAPKQIEAANHAIRHLNIPWQELFDALEGKVSEHVAILSLEPDASLRSLRLQAEAKTAENMIDFVEELARHSIFVSARLTRHEISESDRNRPYRFILEAEWPSDL